MRMAQIKSNHCFICCKHAYWCPTVVPSLKIQHLWHKNKENHLLVMLEDGRIFLHCGVYSWG